MNQNHCEIAIAPGSVSVHRQAILDHRLPHGAFRLFNYLRDRQNRNGQTWETQRQISSDLKCKQDSVIEWTKILVNIGYIGVERIGQNHNFRYTVLCGDGNVALPQWASRAAQTRAARKGSAKENLVIPKKEAALPQGQSPRDPQKGSLRSSQEVTTQLRGEQTPPGCWKNSGKKKREMWQLLRDRERVLKALRYERERSTPDKDLIKSLIKQKDQIIAEIKATMPLDADTLMARAGRQRGRPAMRPCSPSVCVASSVRPMGEIGKGQTADRFAG